MLLLTLLVLTAKSPAPALKPPKCADVRIVNSDLLMVRNDLGFTILYNKPGQYQLPREVRGQLLAGVIVSNYSPGITVYSFSDDAGQKTEDSLRSGEEGKYSGGRDGIRLAEGEILVASPGVVMVYLLKEVEKP